MENLMKLIGYNFKNPKLLKTALTHSSYANENNVQSYERLEFLGDSILSFVVSKHLYNSKNAFPEGEMSKLRAAIVCERSLDECALKIGIGSYLILSKGEEMTGGRRRMSILADAFESILAAIYLDSGLDEAEKFILSQLGNAIENAKNGVCIYMDYKTELQEIAQSVNKKVEYMHIKEEGPAHNRRFTVQVLYDGKAISEDIGRSKKEAEQNAARLAIIEVKNDKV
ncbi:MAG: ribonuclease III [Clostridia bacterium]|nr:ribonuclease III [Clostridia bacterium]